MFLQYGEHHPQHTCQLVGSHFIYGKYWDTQVLEHSVDPVKEQFDKGLTWLAQLNTCLAGDQEARGGTPTGSATFFCRGWS